MCKRLTLSLINSTNKFLHLQTAPIGIQRNFTVLFSFNFTNCTQTSLSLTHPLRHRSSASSDIFKRPQHTHVRNETIDTQTAKSRAAQTVSAPREVKWRVLVNKFRYPTYYTITASLFRFFDFGARLLVFKCNATGSCHKHTFCAQKKIVLVLQDLFWKWFYTFSNFSIKI